MDPDATIPSGQNGSIFVRDALLNKHPEPCVPPASVLPCCDALPLFEDVEVCATHIQAVACRIQGGAGPGGCDAAHWRDVLLRYGAHSGRLRDSVAAVARRLCNSITPWDDVRALVASRLIALDKFPGVRPIGIGETLRRVIGKAVCMATRSDIEVVCGSDQLYAGLKAGIEGAVHAMSDLYDANIDSIDGWGVLLVDASNAFNSLNRISMLLHARVLWPRCSRFLFNTYRGWSVLVLRGSSDFLYSKEGITQGDPLSMFMYAVGILPLIRSLHNPTQWTQVWYADDASVCGCLNDIHEWFSQLCSKGPAFGYYPEPSKSYLLVNDRHRIEAERLFGALGVQIVAGHRFLGGYLGDHAGCEHCVSDKVRLWVTNLLSLTKVAVKEPQATYAVLTKSFQNEWTFLQRVVAGCDQAFRDLEYTLFSQFLPVLFGCEITPSEHQLFSLPTRLGGLGILDPTTSASRFYQASVHATSVLSAAIREGSTLDLGLHVSTVLTARRQDAVSRDVFYGQQFDELLRDFDPYRQRAILRAKDQNISAWLSALPLVKNHFDLAAQEFRDALALRYKKSLSQMPKLCDGCGAEFSTEHALDCRFGGLVSRRHNEIRDAIGDLASLVWGNVVREPVVCDRLTSSDGALVADLCVRGVWIPQSEALFDIRVVDTDAQSYRNRTPLAVLCSAECDKKRKYLQACLDRRATFTHCVCQLMV